MAKAQKADKVKAVQPSTKELAEQVNTEQKTAEYKLVNLFKYRTLNNLATCEARDMKLEHGQIIVNPDDKQIGTIEEIHAKWLAVKDEAGQVWVGLDDWTLSLQKAPLDARGRYLKRTKDDKPIKHGFQFCHVRVVPDADGKPTGNLYKK